MAFFTRRFGRPRTRSGMLPFEPLENRRLLSGQKIKVFFDDATSTSGDLYLSIVDKVNAYKVDATSGLVSLDATPGSYASSYRLTGATPQLPTAGGVPYVVLEAADGSGASQQIISGRFYLSDSPDAVAMSGSAPGTISPTAGFTWDLVEFTLNGTGAANSLNLDLSQIDQFGMPITITTSPPDADFPNGAGVLPTLSRQDVFDQFAAYAAEPAYSAYAGIVQTSPSRLLGPHHLIDQLTQAAAPNGILKYAASIGGSTKVSDGYEATLTLTGTWTEPNQGSKAPLNTSITTAYQVRGQSLPAGTSVKAVSTTNQNQVTLFSSQPFPDATTVPLSFFVPPSTPLVTAFDQAIHDLFAAFSTPTHILATPGAIYEGELRQDFAVPSINDTGATTNYTVIEFTELGTFSGLTNTITAPAGTPQKYQVFYPYFTTNSTASPNGNALTPGGVPAPPKWWKPGYYGGGQLDWLTSPSQMVFACDGVFADDVYQEQYFVNEKGDSNWDHTVLGNIENQMSSWLNRGMSPSGNLENRVGFLAGADLIRVDLTQKKATTADDLLPDQVTGAQVYYLPSQLTSAIPSPPADGWGVVWPTLTGTLKLGGTAIQSFTVERQLSGGTMTLPMVFTDIGSPSNKATSGLLQLEASGAVQNIYMTMESASGLDQLSVSFAFDYGPATTEARYGTVSLLSPPAGWTDTTAGTAGIEAGMKMIAFSQFKTPMEVYQVDATAGTVTLYAPTGLQAFNTNVLQFADFYPVDSKGNPVGSWNAYSGFWHEGDRRNGVAAPTIDARSYAFPFDDDGGYSSDINLTWQQGSQGQVGTVTVALLAWSTPLSGDFNGDGLTDVAAWDASTGEWTAWLTPTTPGGPPTPVPMATWSTADTWSDFLVGDFTGDGADDVAGRNQTGAWYVIAKTGGTTTAPTFTSSPWIAGQQTVRELSDLVVGDFDGDGHDDIAGRRINGTWWYIHEQGGSIVASPMARWTTNMAWSMVVCGNFIGDASGREQIAGRNSNGVWWMIAYDSQQTAFTNTSMTPWSRAFTWADAVVGDFTGDGRDDIAARRLFNNADPSKKLNSWFVISCPSTTFQTSNIGKWPGNQTWLDIRPGDFLGNGLAGIAGRSASTGNWQVLQKSGGSYSSTNFGGGWSPAGNSWQVFAGLFNPADTGSNRKTGLLGRAMAGNWVVSLSGGSSFTTTPVTFS